MIAKIVGLSGNQWSV